MDKYTNNLIIVMYHYTRHISDSILPGLKGMEIEEFRQQIQFLKKNFNIVKMEDVIEASKGKITLPNNSVLLTFDDGYIDNYLYAMPILKEFDVQGTFFLTSKYLLEGKLLYVNKIQILVSKIPATKLLKDIFVELDKYRKIHKYFSNEELYQKYAVGNWLDNKDIVCVKRLLQDVLPDDIRWAIVNVLFNKHIKISEKALANQYYLNKEQINVMKANGMFIGLHGNEHYRLAKIDPEIMKKDIDKCFDTFSEFIDKDNWVFAYPYGDYDQNVINHLKSKGCSLAVIVGGKITKIGVDSPYEYARLDCVDFPPRSENYKKKIVGK